MKCYKHIDVEAVATCKMCNGGLCSDCTEIVDQPICLMCALKSNNALKKGILFRILITIICFFAPIIYSLNIYFSGGVVPFQQTMFFSMYFVLMFWGLSVYKHFPFYVVLTSFKWFYFGLMIIVSTAPLVGLIYAPIRFIKMYLEMKKIKELERFSESGEEEQLFKLDDNVMIDRNRINPN